MPIPIPLICRDNGGTGFLVTDGSSVWMTTCAHLATGEIDTPPNLNLFAGAEIVVPATGSRVPFTSSGTQRFTAAIAPDGNLVDAVAIKLTGEEAAALAEFGTYHLSSLVSVGVGDTVTAQGYPGIGQGIIKLTNLVAEVTAQQNHIRALSQPSLHGISGGPVLSRGRLVGIIYGDRGSGDKLWSGLFVAFEGVASHLFV